MSGVQQTGGPIADWPWRGQHRRKTVALQDYKQTVYHLAGGRCRVMNCVLRVALVLILYNNVTTLNATLSVRLNPRFMNYVVLEVRSKLGTMIKLFVLRPPNAKNTIRSNSYKRISYCISRVPS